MSRGGLRCGAGRPGWRRKCEHRYGLDVRVLKRKGCLAVGSYTGWHWSRDGEQIANIGIRAYSNFLELVYTWTPYGDEPRPVICRVELVTTACTYGGSRQWFRCPVCARRCAKIYGLSRTGGFACRVCERLAYSSEAEDRLDRLWRKQHKLEAKLDANWCRPKRMRLRTYERLQHAIIDVVVAREDEFEVRSAALLAQLGGRW
jgi:hypothetical protein